MKTINFYTNSNNLHSISRSNFSKNSLEMSYSGNIIQGDDRDINENIAKDKYITEFTNRILRRFGVTKCYRGFPYTSYAIFLAVTEEFRLEAVVKEIYMETASYFGCSWIGVERDIRTVVSHAWRTDPELLCKLAGYRLTCAPTASDFIAIISDYIVRAMAHRTQNMQDVQNEK